MHILDRETERVFKSALDKIVDIGIAHRNRLKPLEYRDREQLIAMSRSFVIENEGSRLEQLIADFDLLAKYSLNFSSPNFLAMPDNGASIAGLLGDIARLFINQNTVNIEYSPLASFIEIRLLETLRRLVGFPTAENTEMLAIKTGGAFTFGGYGSNLSCLLIAREWLRKELTSEGERFDPRRTRVLAARPFAHYSLRRNLDILGLGNRDLTVERRNAEGLEEESVVNVESHNYRMDPIDLERKLENTLGRGDKVMAIFAIAGESRAMGFDDLKAILKLARKHKIWVHVDACQGGQCLFSKKRRADVLQGVEEVDSISLDPHKVLMVPYNLSAFFVGDFRHLYLLPKGASVITNEDDALGKFTPGIGSKAFISLKLYFVLRHWGLLQVSEEIERRHELALQCAQLLRINPRFILLNPEVQHNSVVFMVKPAKSNPAVSDYNALNRTVYQMLTQEGDFFVHTFPTRDDAQVITSNAGDELWPLRLMFGNPRTSIENIQACLERIALIATECEVST